MASKIKLLDEKYSLLNGIDLREYTIDLLHKGYLNKQFTPVEVVNYYLERIKVLNPYLNAVIEVSQQSLEEAKQMEILCKENGELPPLYGVPILIKDNIATNGMETTCGSLALVGVTPKEDATVTKLLKQAGAIILGKANMTEFAGFRDEIDPFGWSARGGQTNNPYVLSKHASGSSSGSASSIASNLAIASLGTETDGSIIAPSSTCGLVGLKPTVGLTSRAGVIPLSNSQDSVGVISRTITDNAKILSVIYNKADPRDAATLKVKPQLKPLIPDLNLVKGIKIGLVEYPYFELEEKVKLSLPLFKDTLAKLSNKFDIDVLDNLKMETHLFSMTKETIVFNHELKHCLNHYLATEVDYKNDKKIDSLEKIIQFNKDHHEKELHLFGQGLLIEANSTTDLKDPTYLEALESNKQGAIKAIDDLLNDNGLDLLCGPADPDASFYTPAAIATYPVITLPLGYYPDGEPFGLALIGKPCSEALLLRIAYCFEKIIPPRKIPQFIN